MTQKTSPFIEGKYGWDFGESGWNSGMDENLTKFSFLFDRNIDAIVSTLPTNPTNGQAFFLTTDNRMYFRVESNWYSTPTPKWFEFQIRSTGVVYKFDGSSVSVVESPSSFDSRIDALEVTASSLGTAAFEDVEFFATRSELDVVEAESADYTDELRQDLANPDMGAAMVARGVVAVDSIADLLALPEGQRKVGLRYLVKGYHAGSDVGGGEFYWSSNVTEPDDGGVVFRVGDGGFRRIISGEVLSSFWGSTSKFLFVNPTGSNENSGTIDSPLETLQGAFDRLASWGSFFVGQFEIRLSAGEHTSTSYIEGLNFSQRLRISGEPVNASETPLTIFNMSGANNHGFRFRGLYCRLKDIKIQDGDNANYAGIQGLQSDVYTINCHSENMAWYGMTFDENSKAYIQGGKHSNGWRGVRFYAGTTYRIGYNVKTTFLNLESTGVQAQGYSYGIFDEVSIDNCGVGINLLHSRARVGRSDFFNNDIDLRLGPCSSWSESSGNTGLNNVVYQSGASELTLDNSSRNFTTMGYVAGTTVSGTTERTVLAELWTNAPGLIKGDRGIRIQVKGSCAGVGTKGIEVRIGLASIYTPAAIPSGTKWFILTCDIVNIEGSLNYFGTLETESGKSVLHSTRPIDLGVSTSIFTIYAVPGDQGGSVTLHSAQLDIVR